MSDPPSKNPEEIRRWARWLFNESSDECWLDASWARNFLNKCAEKLQIEQIKEEKERARKALFEL